MGIGMYECSSKRVLRVFFSMDVDDCCIDDRDYR